MSLKVAIVGPGRSKQGTGPFIARTFKQLGADVQGIVSSSLNSATQAAEVLKSEYGIDCQTYKNLEQLLENHNVDIVAISCPFDYHLENIHAAIQAGCHVFCEKPLWWPSSKITSENDVHNISKQTTALLNSCKIKSVILQVNTQWPYTLPTYYELYPQIKNQQSVDSFAMWLSPQSQGHTMILDAVPHVLSMLYTLVGAGKINNIDHNCYASKPNHDLQIEFDYLHTFGDTRVSILLTSSDRFPKPAAYAVNGLRADRHVELTNYLISLQSDDHQLPVEDPLVCSIKNFISTIHSKATSDDVALIDGMTHLAQIYQAVTENRTSQ